MMTENPKVNTVQSDVITGKVGKDELIQLVTFTVNEEEYGIEILSVQEIIRIMEVTKVPRAPACVEGVINLRGKVIPIIDLRRCLNLPLREYDKDTRIIVMKTKADVIGFISDSVSQVLRITSDTVETSPALLNGNDSEYISGIGKVNDRLLILLNMDKLFSGLNMS